MSGGPEVVGYVEATTPTQVLGWAWAPRSPNQRVTVQAMLGQTVVAETTADREREDLRKNGIGDGRHAFELKLPDAARERTSELLVVVRNGAGAPVRLGVPPPPLAIGERLDRLQRAVDGLINSHRVMHRNLQAVLAGPRAPEVPASPPQLPPPPAMAEIAAMQDMLRKQMAALETCATRLDMQEQLSKQMATLEIFVMRLDERLAVPPAPPPPPPKQTMGKVALALAGLALLLSLLGLLRELP
jgi:hypothetical protein